MIFTEEKMLRIKKVKNCFIYLIKKCLKERSVKRFLCLCTVPLPRHRFFSPLHGAFAAFFFFHKMLMPPQFDIRESPRRSDAAGASLLISGLAPVPYARAQPYHPGSSNCAHA